MIQIPSFPLFKNLELSDQKSIEKITSRFNAYSDFNFASMWNYDTENTIRWSVLHKNLIVQFADYITGDPFLSFIGHQNIVSTAHELLDYAANHHLPPYLKLIPQEVIDYEPHISEFFVVKDDPHNHDYILSVEEYLTFPGKKFSSKRKNLRKFNESFPHATAEQLDLSDNTIQSEIFDVFQKWAAIRSVPKDEYTHEFKATRRFIEAHRHFNYIALGIRDGTKLLAYSLMEKEQKTFIQHHFLKTLTTYQYKGLFEKLDHEMALIAHTDGYSFVNIQQDIGIEGLRHAKSLGRPVTYLKKYIISEKK